MKAKEWYDIITDGEAIRIRMSDIQFTYMEAFAEYYHKEQNKDLINDIEYRIRNHKDGITVQ